MTKSTPKSNAVKIKPQSWFGDTPASNVLRIVGYAQKKVIRWGGLLAALSSAWATAGGSIALMIPAVVISGKIYEMCNEMASLMDIENLLSDRDMAEMRALIGDGTSLSRQMKKYKNFGDMPEKLQAEINEYFNSNYKTIKQLRNALNEVEIKAKKSIGL